MAQYQQKVKQGCGRESGKIRKLQKYIKLLFVLTKHKDVQEQNDLFVTLISCPRSPWCPVGPLPTGQVWDKYRQHSHRHQEPPGVLWPPDPPPP